MTDNLIILSDKQQYYTWEEQQDAVMKENSGILDIQEEECNDWTSSVVIRPEFIRGSGVPKYKQLAFAIIEAMQSDRIKGGDVMPSIKDYATIITSVLPQ